MTDEEPHDAHVIARDNFVRASDPSWRQSQQAKRLAYESDRRHYYLRNPPISRAEIAKREER